jgi:dihydroorotase
MSTDELIIRRPDDMHVHLRDGDLLTRVLPYTANVFGRALVMPNLTPAILTGDDALRYSARIRSALGVRGTERGAFQPLMTIKITGATTAKMIWDAKSAGVIAGKIYPAGVTTNSADGVSDFVSPALHEVFSAMADVGMVLCIHAEMPGIPSMHREEQFINRFVLPWAERYPSLKIVIEHATTRHAVEMAREYPNIGCSLTVHHMLLTLDDVIGDKLDPHCFCKPIAKTEDDRQAIIEAAVGGDPSFFLGTDSAPHLVQNKHAAHAAAGCFTAPVAMELLAQIFDERGALNTLEMFASENGARFYGLPLNEGKIKLVRREHTVPNGYHEGGVFHASNPGGLVPFWYGKKLEWEVANVQS